MWNQFQANQRQLDDNRTWRAEEHRGAVREGPSLLQEIVLCGSCGRRMSIRYQRDGSLLMYECNQAHKQLGTQTCQTMRGDRIDRAVVQCFLEAIQPAHLEVALSALDSLEMRAKQIESQWQRQIERAQYEADLAQRRYKAVDPDNRLVARSLEREWNEKLAEVEKLEREYALGPKPAVLLLNAAQREQIRSLAQDLPAIWHAPTTTFAQRKQSLRWLIKDVTLSKRGNVIDVVIRWQTEAQTRLAMKQATDQVRAQGQPGLSQKEVAIWQARVLALLSEGDQAHPRAPTPKGKRGKAKQHPARNLLDRLRKHQDAFLLFLQDLRVPFDNNLAERDIRMVKVQQKVSGSFRSTEGAVHFCRIRGYLSTLRKQSLHVFSALQATLCGRPLLPSF